LTETPKFSTHLLLPGAVFFITLKVEGEEHLQQPGTAWISFSPGNGKGIGRMAEAGPS